MPSFEQAASYRILLVRHGHYERTDEQGDTVWGLSPLGRRQSVRLGRRLARVVEASSAEFEGVYASPWPRGLQTAEIAAREMELDSLKVKPYLHEVVPLVDSAGPSDEPRAASEMFVRPTGAETSSPPMGADLAPTSVSEERDKIQAQVDRVRRRFFQPVERNRLVVLVTHGNLIRYLVTGVLGLPLDAWSRMDVAHTGLSEIRVYAVGFEVLVTFNETGHLPTSMVTSQ